MHFRAQERHLGQSGNKNAREGGMIRAPKGGEEVAANKRQGGTT